MARMGISTVSPISGKVVQISGQVVDISGQSVNITDVSIASGKIAVLSGEVAISGTVSVLSGHYMASGIHVVTTGGGGGQVSGAVQVSGTVNASQEGTWGVIVSGDVNTSVSGDIVQISGQKLYPVTLSGDYVVISGTVDTSVSGDIVQISGQSVEIDDVAISGTVSVLSGHYMASGVHIVTDGGGQVSGAVQVSGTVSASQEGTWGVIVSGDVNTSVSGDIVQISGQSVVAQDGFQISGAVQVSGTVDTSVSGNIIDISQPTSVITQATTNPKNIADSSGGECLTSSDCISVVVKTLSANSGDMYLGGSTADEAPYSGHGLLLEAGEAVNIDIDNTGLVHACAAISGDRVSWIANN